MKGIFLNSINKEMKEEEVNKVPDIEPYTGKKMIPVNQFDLTGKFIKHFDSIEQASEELSIPFSQIRLCLTGFIKTAGNYQWRVKQ